MAYNIQKDISIVVTSCNRHDLLKRTLESFATYNSYPINKLVIIEDGGVDLEADTVKSWVGDKLGDIKVIVNSKRKGQIYSVDRAYAEVNTEYIFHLEDDWEFLKAGFVEESLSILENNPKIIMVSLRTDWQHPFVTLPEYNFPIVQPNWDGGWGGFSFNPGLRRLSDYRTIGSYGKHVGYNPYEVGELYLSKFYLALGFNIASLPDCPYCQHIGWGNRHVEWKTAPKPSKILIAIPMCWKYEYKTQDDGNIHKSGESNERIDAQRGTWLKGLKAFKSYVDFKYFYGKKPEGVTREPKSDEIFLDCGDDYLSLTDKLKAIIKYALDNGYDYLFKTDDDTFVYLDRLLSSGFDEYDYTGYCTNNPAHPQDKLYASGGPGYWLSRKAMEILNKATNNDWAEDRWVGAVLYANGIKVTRDARYLPGFREHYVNISNLPENHSYISLHAITPDVAEILYNSTVNPNFTLIKNAIGDDYQGDDPRVEMEDILNDVLLTSSDLDNNSKAKINKSIEKLVNLLIVERRRVDVLEDRLSKYNTKASHKI